jgi:hypothetical protein
MIFGKIRKPFHPKRKKRNVDCFPICGISKKTHNQLKKNSNNTGLKPD